MHDSERTNEHLLCLAGNYADEKIHNVVKFNKY